MEPRLPSSIKWTSLPKDLLNQIESVFLENFAEPATTGSFKAEGRIYKQELLLRVGYLKKASLAQNNIEVSISYNAMKENLTALIHLAVDVAASLHSDWFQSPELQIPLLWEEFQTPGRIVHVQSSRVNSELENQANLLLGGDESLISGEDPDDSEQEVLGLKRLLGLDPDEPTAQTSQQAPQSRKISPQPTKLKSRKKTK